MIIILDSQEGDGATKTVVRDSLNEREKKDDNHTDLIG